MFGKCVEHFARIVADAPADCRSAYKERALMVDLLKRSVNAPGSNSDVKCAEVAKKRLQELRSGKVKPVPGNEVFSKVHKRLAK